MIKRAAFVVGLARHNGWGRQVAGLHAPRVVVAEHFPPASRTARYLSSTFQAPEPPQSKGQAVYNDIDFTVANDPKSQCGLRNSDPEAVFVVSGASRGIGLQFVRSLIGRTRGVVVACCRSPDSAEGLNEAISLMTNDEKERIRLVKLDLENQNSIEEAAGEIKKSFGRVDMLLNVAGVLGDAQSTPGPERTIAKLDRDWMEKTLNVNVVGPVMLSKELAPLMAQRRGGKKAESEMRPKAVIANLSARVGSISDNELGGWYSYRMSKSALNQATRTMSHELKRQSVWCIALHPGTTDTDLSKPFQRNVQEGRLFPVQFTVDSLLKVIDSMTDENSGGLYDWAGKAIPF